MPDVTTKMRELMSCINSYSEQKMAFYWYIHHVLTDINDKLLAYSLLCNEWATTIPQKDLRLPEEYIEKGFACKGEDTNRYDHVIKNFSSALTAHYGKVDRQQFIRDIGMMISNMQPAALQIRCFVFTLAIPNLIYGVKIKNERHFKEVSTERIQQLKYLVYHVIEEMEDLNVIMRVILQLIEKAPENEKALIAVMCADRLTQQATHKASNILDMLLQKFQADPKNIGAVFNMVQTVLSKTRSNFDPIPDLPGMQPRKPDKRDIN